MLRFRLVLSLLLSCFASFTIVGGLALAAAEDKAESRPEKKTEETAEQEQQGKTQPKASPEETNPSFLQQIKGLTNKAEDFTLFAQRDVHIWQRYIRGFRRGHSFSLSLGGSSGLWSVDHLGTVFGQAVESTGAFAKARYSFHLPIYKGFGYFLGSSLGYHYESADETLAVVPVSSVHYPGLMVGAVLNFTPGLRVMFFVDYYLERFEEFAEHDGISSREDGLSDDSKISVSMSSVDFAAALDFFLSLKWGLRVEFHQRTSRYEQPQESSTHPTNAAISKKDRWFGVGAVFHLL